MIVQKEEAETEDENLSTNSIWLQQILLLGFDVITRNISLIF